MLRVLVVDEALPLPADSGKRIRTVELLRRLAATHAITLLVPAEAPHDPAAVEALGAAGIEVQAVPRPPLRKRGLRFAFDLARNVFSPDPYIVAAHRVPAVGRAVVGAVRAGRADLVHVEWTPLLANVPAEVEIPVCVAAHNVEAQIWERYERNERRCWRRAYVAHQTRKVRRFEAAAVARAAAVTAVSEADAEALGRWTDPARVTVVPNGVDPVAFAPAPESATVPGRALFVGSLDWRPNQDAVVWFLDAAWPPLRRLRPDASLDVVGRHPPGWLARRLAREEGVRLHATVPDVRPHLAAASVSVVPLRVGGGSRLKICESLAAGRPVVTTEVGAEGLDVGDGVVRAPAEGRAFAEAVAEALAGGEAVRAQAARGRARVLRHHAWDAIAPRQAEAWRRAAEAAA